jgi:hypothetical protein
MSDFVLLRGSWSSSSPNLPWGNHVETPKATIGRPLIHSRILIGLKLVSSRRTPKGANGSFMECGGRGCAATGDTALQSRRAPINLRQRTHKENPVRNLPRCSMGNVRSVIHVARAKRRRSRRTPKGANGSYMECGGIPGKLCRAAFVSRWTCAIAERNQFLAHEVHE